MNIPEGYYAILFKEKGSGTIGVRFPDHPGITTYGRDWDHAEEMAEEALAAALETEFDRKQPLPKARKPKAKRGERLAFIRMDPDIRIAYLLRARREEAQLTQKQLATRLGISYQAYQRMERPGRSNLTIATLERIANALHGELIVDLRV